MTDKEKAMELYREQAREIWSRNTPWLQQGAKIVVSDASKFSDMKNNIMDKMLSVHAPLLEEKDKLAIWAEFSDKFDDILKEHNNENQNPA